MKPIKKVKFSWKEREYWSQVLIACSQVSFGLFWASLFVPIDKGKLIILLLNLILTFSLLISGWLLVRKNSYD
jgi:hypothetical protein